ncbi:MAG TPA: DUF4097 family beta strand repeat-containing protein [Pyrinomonadaceae bacterium]|nr:DUF4097 family beta strand repeat-containing protein [Pyrinomonadaceae bacterium]
MSWLYSLVFAGLLFSSNGDQAASHPQYSAAPVLATQIVATDEVERFEHTYPLTKNGNVSVSNVNGSIVVEAWDREEVKLEATKIADSKESLAEVDLDIESTPSSFSVEADYKATNWNDKRNENRNRKLEVEFHLFVPRTAILNEIETVNGSVTVSNFTNVTKISAVNGNVNATNLRGAANLSTVNGQVMADFDRVDAASKINLSTVNGTVSLVVPSDLNATIKADSLNGNITNDFGLPMRKGQYVGRDLYGRVGTGEAQIKLNSVNGKLSIGRKADGRTPNPATNLLPSKKADEDWDDDDDNDESSAADTAKVNREIARAMRESQKVTAESMREAQRAIEAVGPQIEKVKIDELKKIEKMKIDLDSEKIDEQVREGMRARRSELDRMRQAVWFAGTPTVQKKRNAIPVKGTPKVNIEAKGCAVSVRGWDKSEVQYIVTEVAGRRGRAATVTEDKKDSTITLKIINNIDGSALPMPAFQLDPERVRVEVYVPRKSNLRIITDGEIRLDGVSGDIELKGEDESINVRDVDGHLNLSANEARVRVIGFKGDFDSQTACGDVFLEGDFKTLTAKATDGTVTLTLPDNTNASFVSNTEVESEGVEVIQEDEHTWRLGRGGSRFNFDFNEGKLVVRGSSAVNSN